MRETFEAETNAARTLDVVLRHLTAEGELTQFDLTAQPLPTSAQGYVKIKPSYRITMSDNDITPSCAGVRFSLRRSQVVDSASGAFADGESITAFYLA